MKADKLSGKERLIREPVDEGRPSGSLNTNINYHSAPEAAERLYGMRAIAAYLGEELSKLQDRGLSALVAASFGRRHHGKNRKKIAERPIPSDNRW